LTDTTISFFSERYLKAVFVSVPKEQNAFSPNRLKQPAWNIAGCSSVDSR